MDEKSGWDLLEERDLQAALKALMDEHRQDPFKGTLVNLGICYLMLGEAAEAKKFFDEAVSMPLPDTGTHAFAGIARWCLNDREDAVSLWCAGLDCDYRDEAGGMELPLLLYYASVRQPEISIKARAEELIKHALVSPRARNWPGGLGRYVLKEIDEDQARMEADAGHPIVTARQLNELEFYKGVIALDQGDTTLFNEQMQTYAMAEECELGNEWHLARYECANFRERGHRAGPEISPVGAIASERESEHVDFGHRGASRTRPNRRAEATDRRRAQTIPIGGSMANIECIGAATTDGFLMALELVERLTGLTRVSIDDKLRALLREVAEGRLTLISEEILRRGKGLPLLEGLLAEERKRAARILEGLEVLAQ